MIFKVMNMIIENTSNILKFTKISFCLFCGTDYFSVKNPGHHVRHFVHCKGMEISVHFLRF